MIYTLCVSDYTVIEIFCDIKSLAGRSHGQTGGGLISAVFQSKV